MRPGGVLVGVMALALVPHTRSSQAVVPVDCDAPPPEVASPSSSPWVARDVVNQACAHQRLDDQISSPAFALKFWSSTPGAYLDGVRWQTENPGTLRLTAAQLIPGLSTADPFRLADEWRLAGRGRVTPISFTSSYSGALQTGEIWKPPAAVPGPYPGVIITTAANQAYRRLYNWAAEGLAEAGYLVLTYDIPTQGGSETFSRDRDGNPTIPRDCLPNAFLLVCYWPPAIRDAINFLLSPANPELGSLNAAAVALAGHGLGAAWSTVVGQEDPRIKTIVSWDSTGFLPLTVLPKVHAPILFISADYPSQHGPEPRPTAPDPFAHQHVYLQLQDLGTDTMAVGLRASTHWEWSYFPYVKPASRYGERLSFYYTLAWLDAYLKGSADGFRRLTARVVDSSADSSSIGAGTSAVAADGTANLPYLISGSPVANRLSFYYRSSYWLKVGALQCDDLRIDLRSDGAPCDKA